MKPTLEDAIALALSAHRGQKDKAGAPYILHPLRVMLTLSSEEEQIAAVLHDVVEDSDHTIESLRQMGYDEETLVIVDCLTRREEEDYFDYVRRAGAHPTARQIKLADLQDNMNRTRLNTLSTKDNERLERYRKAWEMLQIG